MSCGIWADVLDVILTMVILEHSGFDSIPWSDQLLRFTRQVLGVENELSQLACYPVLHIKFKG